MKKLNQSAIERKDERESGAEAPDLINLMEWNRFAEQGMTLLEVLTILNNRHRAEIEAMMVAEIHAMRELNAAKAALSGRTVSCSACNAMAEELAAMKKVIRKIYYETETYADGAPDATDHDKLCNEITYELKTFIHNKDI